MAGTVVEGAAWVLVTVTVTVAACLLSTAKPEARPAKASAAIEERIVVKYRDES